MVKQAFDLGAAAASHAEMEKKANLLKDIVANVAKWSGNVKQTAGMVRSHGLKAAPALARTLTVPPIKATGRGIGKAFNAPVRHAGYAGAVLGTERAVNAALDYTAPTIPGAPGRKITSTQPFDWRTQWGLPAAIAGGAALAAYPLLTKKDEENE